MTPAAANPYQPGRGVPPPLLAGRTSEVGAAERRLERLDAGRMPSQDLLFHGPRGNGKTTLLIEIERHARKRGLRVENLPVNTLTSQRRLVRHLQERSGLVRDRLTGVQLAGTGATADRAGPSENVDFLLDAWIRSADEPLVILLDEVHAIAPEEARPFFDAVQTAKTRSTPFLIVAAGTPGAPQALREAGTFNERGFERVRVSRLSREDTATAIGEPARRSGRAFREDALALVTDESQGYPYFVQLLGSAAWNAAAAADVDAITLESAEQALRSTRTVIHEFYEERYDEAWQHRIGGALAPLARRFVESGRPVADSGLVSLLERLTQEGAVAVDVVLLRNTLRDLGVIWQTSPAVWEMGIPSFANYVLRRDLADESRSATR